MHAALDICSLLVPRGPVLYVVDAYKERYTFRSYLDKKPFANLVVLVDEYTASAAELITAALQDAGAAVVIGTNTFGKGTVQTWFPLSNKGTMKITTAEFFRRSGEKLNGIGVIPDFEVEMHYDDYETPNDAAILKALEVLKRR